jgi:hypothetical protein
MIMETGERDKIIEEKRDIRDEKELSGVEAQMDCYATEELSDETVSEVEIADGKNYYLSPPQELLDELKNLVDNFPIERIKKEVEAIRDAFYKNLNDSSENDSEENNDSSAIEPADNLMIEEFEKYLEKYRDKRTEHIRVTENQKEENYKQKLAIIEELKDLIKEEEDLNVTFQKFHDIQNRWKEIAQVPQNHIKDLWDTWHYNVEKFYDYVKINKELRDLDLKRNLEAKNELVRKAEALMEYPSIIEAFAQLQQYHDTWREIGPVPREQRDEVWERFKEISYKLNKKHQAYFDQLKRERQHNTQMKIDLCERIERLNQRELKSLKEWQKASDELVVILDEWRSIGFVPKKENNELYNRFKKSRDSFFDRRRLYYKAQKQESTTNYRLKRELCEKAKSLQDSTDWKETTEILVSLQKQWKEVGPIPHKHANALWNEFKAACDIFFSRKAEHFSKRGNDQYFINLQAKEALISELENFVPEGNIPKIIGTLKLFRERWNEIGFVPIKDKDRVQQQFFSLLDEKYKQIKGNRPQRENQPRERSDSYNKSSPKQGKGKREKLFSRIMQLENEVILLENNVGFFASSKNADSMIADVRRKINKTKEEIRNLEEQIKQIDKELE